MSDNLAPTIADLDSLHYANGAPGLAARIKEHFEDFKVDEELGFPLTGSGEHLYLRVRKTDLSTTDVARRLAKATGSRLGDIGYAGMKDRRGECRQWFSLPRASAAGERLAALEDGSLEILDSGLNERKLRIGSHKGNRFDIVLRQLQGSREQFEARLATLASGALPNYFGSQRFGRDMGNIRQVMELMQDLENSGQGAARGRTGGKGRQRRSMLISAARAYLFNQVLSARLARGNWDCYVPGDVLNLDGSDRYFVVEADAWDETLAQRLAEYDIHPSGPLAGQVDSRDRYLSRAEAADIEEAVLAEFPLLRAGLVRLGIKAGRRPLRFRARELDWHWTEAGNLRLQFVLPRGVYATSFLRELCETR